MPDVPSRPEADAEWQELLRQWRAQPAAQPRPFFYARVRARLDARLAQPAPPLPAWLRWPAYVTLGLLLLALSGDAPAADAAPAGEHSSSPAALPRP